MTTFASRRSLLAQVHMAVKELGMTDEMYRSMLAERYGVASSAKLSLAKLVELTRHFERLGWEPKRRPVPRPEIHPLCRKIWAQCYSLGRPVPDYPDAIAQQMFGLDKLTWCAPEQLTAIVTALAKQQAKEGADTA